MNKKNATNARITVKEQIIDFTQMGEINLIFIREFVAKHKNACGYKVFQQLSPCGASHDMPRHSELPRLSCPGIHAGDKRINEHLHLFWALAHIVDAGIRTGLSFFIIFIGAPPKKQKRFQGSQNNPSLIRWQLLIFFDSDEVIKIKNKKAQIPAEMNLFGKKGGNLQQKYSNHIKLKKAAHAAFLCGSYWINFVDPDLRRYRSKQELNSFVPLFYLG